MTAALVKEGAAVAGGTRGELRRGWPTLVYATIGAGVGMSSLGYFLGTLVVPLQEEFGWGRGEINLSSLVSSLGLAIALPFVGRLLDRYGVKRVSIVAIPLFVVTMVLLGTFTSNLTLFLVFYACAGMFGAGTAAVTYSKALVERFDRRRGLALGIMAGGLGTAGLIMPPLMGAVVASDAGWRGVYFTMAVLACVPFALVWFAKLAPPAQRGGAAGRQDAAGLPGGAGATEASGAVAGSSTAAAPGTAAASGAPAAASVSASPTPAPVAAVDEHGRPQLFSEAVRRREFWTLCVVFFLLGWALLTMVPHFVPLLIDSGVEPVQAALLSSLVGVGTVIARPVIGLLFDRLYATYVAVPLFIAAALGCLLLLWGGAPVAPLTALLIGIGFGAEIDLMSYLSSRYFGPRAFGSLYSLVYSLFMVGSALGPVLAGYLFDATGTYASPLVIAASMMGVAAAMLLTLPRFVRGDGDAVPGGASGVTHASAGAGASGTGAPDPAGASGATTAHITIDRTDGGTNVDDD